MLIRNVVRRRLSPPRAARRGASALVGSVAATLLTIPPTRVGAQATPQRLDVGSFTIVLNGQRVGREQFSMQRLAGVDGATLEVRSESATGERRTAMRLEVDSAGTPVRYSVEERRGADESLRLGGQRVRGRFATLSRSTTGEAAREYLLRPGAVVVEDEGVVQYALLVRGRALAPGAGVTLPSLTPIANSQGAVRVVLEAERDTVTIANARRTARRWRIVTASGDTRLVWAEAEGLLLRVRIPNRGLEAIRDDVPR